MMLRKRRVCIHCGEPTRDTSRTTWDQVEQIIKMAESDPDVYRWAWARLHGLADSEDVEEAIAYASKMLGVVKGESLDD